MVRIICVAVIIGFRISAVLQFSPSSVRIARHTVVLPAPTSPVIWMKPLRSRMPKRTWLNASRCLSEKKRKRGSGVMLKGASRNP